MQNKPFLVMSIILTMIVAAYFFIFGFSDNKATRYGQYAGLVLCAIVVKDNLFR